MCRDARAFHLLDENTELGRVRTIMVGKAASTKFLGCCRGNVWQVTDGPMGRCSVIVSSVRWHITLVRIQEPNRLASLHVLHRLVKPTVLV